MPELQRIAVVLGSGLGDFAQSLEGGVSCSRLSHRFHTLEPIASQTRSPVRHQTRSHCPLVSDGPREQPVKAATTERRRLEHAGDSLGIFSLRRSGVSALHVICPHFPSHEPGPLLAPLAPHMMDRRRTDRAPGRRDASAAKEWSNR